MDNNMNKPQSLIEWKTEGVRIEDDESQALLNLKAKSWTLKYIRQQFKTLKWQIWTNLMALNLFVSLYSGFMTVIMSAQTSINYKDGLGAKSLSVLTVACIIGSFLFNPIYRRFGAKCCFAIALAGQTVFILSNLYVRWYTLVIAAVVAGICQGTCLVYFKLHIAQLAHRYCETRNQEHQVDRVQSRMFMLHVLTYKLFISAVFPMSSLMLGINPATPTTPTNDTNYYNNATSSHCGVDYCNEGFDLTKSTKDKESDEQIEFIMRLKLAGFSLLLLVLAALTAFFILPPKESLGIVDDMTKLKKKTFSIGIMKNPKMLLLIPSFVAILMCETFWTVDFTGSFVTCALGLEYVGMVMMWTGVSGALSSLLFGSFNSEKYRKIFISLSLVIQIAVLSYLITWSMENNTYLILCILSACWYIGGGARTNLLSALVAVLFKDDLSSAYSTQNLWSFLGAAMSTFWSNWLCMETKLYTMMIIIILSLVCYIVLEILVYREKGYEKISEVRDTSCKEENDCFSLIRVTFIQ